MPVCIAGMHRSGTSMAAKFLQASGLYLGPEPDVLPGLRENQRFININRQILHQLGGNWDDPPPAPADWAGLALGDIQAEAEAILAHFADREPWGWKDPRTCLTLPFWQGLLGTVPVVIIVRNPLEVAESLRERNGFAIGRGLALWDEYNRRLLDAVAPPDRIVMHYDAYFQSPDVESRRVLTFAGLPLDESTIAAAAGTRKTNRRHHQRVTRDLLAAGVTPSARELYRDLCREAAWSDNGPERSQPQREDPPLAADAPGIAEDGPA